MNLEQELKKIDIRKIIETHNKNGQLGQSYLVKVFSEITKDNNILLDAKGLEKAYTLSSILNQNRQRKEKYLSGIQKPWIEHRLATALMAALLGYGNEEIQSALLHNSMKNEGAVKNIILDEVSSLRKEGIVGIKNLVGYFSTDSTVTEKYLGTHFQKDVRFMVSGTNEKEIKVLNKQNGKTNANSSNLIKRDNLSRMYVYASEMPSVFVISAINELHNLYSFKTNEKFAGVSKIKSAIYDYFVYLQGIDDKLAANFENKIIVLVNSYEQAQKEIEIISNDKRPSPWDKVVYNKSPEERITLGDEIYQIVQNAKNSIFSEVLNTKNKIYKRSQFEIKELPNANLNYKELKELFTNAALTNLKDTFAYELLKNNLPLNELKRKTLVI